MRQPFCLLTLAAMLLAGNIAPVSAQMLQAFGCDSRSGCTYPMETPMPGEAEARSKPKRKPVRTPVISRAKPAAPPVERVALTSPAALQAEPALPFETVIPPALVLSLTFAPPPLAEPRVSPTTCLLERAFSDVHAPAPENTALKPRLFERGVKLLVSRVGAGANEAADQTH